MNERQVITILMQYAMEQKQHKACINNSREFVGWEADLLSLTRANLLHEFEVKVSRADFLADKKKVWKHQQIGMAFASKESDFFRKVPNYFWYVIEVFEADLFEVPVYAGLMMIQNGRFKLLKNAPRIHPEKVAESRVAYMATLLSYRVKNLLREMTHEVG